MYPSKQPSSVAVLTCPKCAEQRWVGKEFIDLMRHVESIDDPQLKVEAVLPRHKPCNAIMHVRMLSEQERAGTVTRTCDRLALALEKAKAPKEMIARARMGYYDDYLSPIGDNIVALVQDAMKYKLRSIADRARDGEFDA